MTDKRSAHHQEAPPEKTRKSTKQKWLIGLAIFLAVGLLGGIMQALGIIDDEDDEDAAADQEATDSEADEADEDTEADEDSDDPQDDDGQDEDDDTPEFTMEATDAGGVAVEFDIRMNGSQELMGMWIEDDVLAAMRQVEAEHPDADYATVTGYGNVTDDYGNSDQEVVLDLEYDAETIQQANWDSTPAAIGTFEICDTCFVHPDLQNGY